MRLAFAVWATLSMLIGGGARLVAPLLEWCGAPPSAEGLAAQGETRVNEVNRPTSPFDCDLPSGRKLYGSRARCLGYLCAGQNVHNEYVFDAADRRRKNPCYGQSPTEFPGE